MKISQTSPLLALCSAALSLPVNSATQPVQTEVSIKTSSYQERDLSESDVLLGETERYDIDINQFRLLTPVSGAWSLGVDISRETMSGASPWGTVAGVDGEASLIMSGATISEKRTEIALSATHYGQNASYSVGVIRSEENDYEATAIRLGGEWDQNNGLSTLSLGISYSSDDIKPTDAEIFGRVTKEDKDVVSTSVSWTQVLDKASTLQVGASLTRHSGFLNDPYKLRDVRPDEKLAWSVNLLYRRYFDNQNAALHLDYRYYSDDFGIDSHTLYAAWYKNLGARFQLAPNVRFYSQKESDFYLAVDDYSLSTDDNQSTDYRLSSYGAYTFGLKAIFNEINWSVNLSVDRYISADKYGMSSGIEHPALVSFDMASIGFDLRF
jgi:hypothetical protein